MNRTTEVTGFKPLVSCKNIAATFQFAKKYLKEPAEFWKNIVWTYGTKIHWYRSDGKYGGQKELPKIQSPSSYL